jgi:F1F0 ATPase subunit 2
MIRVTAMNETLMMVLALIFGTVLGVVFFGGLWWTVRKSLYAKRPALWIFGSLLLRISIVAAGFYLFSGRHWARLLLSVLGFIAARFGIIRLTRPAGQNLTRPAQEAPHAP